MSNRYARSESWDKKSQSQFLLRAYLLLIRVTYPFLIIDVAMSLYFIMTFHILHEWLNSGLYSWLTHYSVVKVERRVWSDSGTTEKLDSTTFIASRLNIA